MSHRLLEETSTFHETKMNYSWADVEIHTRIQQKWKGSKTSLIPWNTDVTSALLPCKADTIKMTTESKAGRKMLADLQSDEQTKWRWWYKYWGKSRRFSVMIGGKALIRWHASTELPPPPTCKLLDYGKRKSPPQNEMVKGNQCNLSTIVTEVQINS